eukprot:TRINITY_DN34170_c0_g1_i1.p1 TRINITY_DN34170_c0_g1~~TRINITY_DN34170_c0_g1_i1.p1  ORF type:complete len:508 (-),score=23.93 TRINITY_DN34170_c0_g1_i1:63-1586(-)
MYEQEPSSPLILAAACGDVETIQATLLQQEDEESRTWADPTQDTDENGDTAMHVAALHGHLEAVMWLAEEYPLMVETSRNYDGHTVLHRAIASSSLTLVQWLIEEAGCDPFTEETTAGDNALSIAAHCGHLDIVQWLVEIGCCPKSKTNNKTSSPLLQAVSGGHLPVVRWLCEVVGCDALNEKDDDGCTPLLQASYKGYLPIVKWLIQERKANPLDCDDWGYSALLAAVLSNRLPVVKWLVREGGSDPKKERDKHQQTALLLAASNGRLDIVKWLVRYGGSNAAIERDQAGHTALSLAAANNYFGKHLDTVEWLLLEGTWLCNRKNKVSGMYGNSVHSNFNGSASGNQHDTHYGPSEESLHELLCNGHCGVLVRLANKGWLDKTAPQIKQHFRQTSCAWAPKQHHKFPEVFQFFSCLLLWGLTSCFPKSTKDENQVELSKAQLRLELPPPQHCWGCVDTACAGDSQKETQTPCADPILLPELVILALRFLPSHAFSPYLLWAHHYRA